MRYTFFMLKRFFQLFFVCILCFFSLFSACKKPNTGTLPPLTRDKVTPFFPKQVEFTPAVLDDGVWNTQETDISYIHTTRKLISFTFDDTPKTSLENILAVFASFNETHPKCKATATLFCNGNLIHNSSFHSLQTALTLGFELGNHSYSHPDLTTLSAEKLRAEIDDTDQLLSRIDNKDKHLFRPPYGQSNDTVNSTVGVPVIDWTIDTLDWTGVSADEIYQTVFNQKFSGAIVLMHDGYANTVSALKRLLPDLEKDGYQVVSVSAMSKAHDCPLKRGSVYIRARKKSGNA